ncbi:MAG: hypothetical protein AB4290_26130 [Spirulina sp.]
MTRELEQVKQRRFKNKWATAELNRVRQQAERDRFVQHLFDK